MLLLQFNKTWAKGNGGFIAPFKVKAAVDTPPQNNTPAPDLPYPFTDQSGNGQPLYNPDGGLMLSNPSNIKTDVIYNPVTGKYEIYQRIGNMDYRIPTEMDSDQFMEYMNQKSEHSYFAQKVQTTTKEQKQNQLIPPIKIGGKLFQDIFGTPYVNIRPQGSAELTFGFNNSKLENPALPVIQRSLTTFNFDENIQLNVTGEIGDKLKLSTTYNTKATFDFQNQMKLAFTGHEDDIIKSIDAGNVTFNLPGTLITGSQSLFGVKTKLQFGRLTSTTVYAQEKGNKKSLTVQNGAQTSNFNVKVDQYMANQHYFLSQFFRKQYDSALTNPPIINSGVTITKIEVWITNTSTATQNTRDIIALSDLGESDSNFTDHNYVKMSPKYLNTVFYAPNNIVNNLNPPTLENSYPNVKTPITAVSGLISAHLVQVTDFEKIDLARMLNPSEYTLNAKLGYISLKQPLNYDQVLGVAYQYTYNGTVYQVGQFSTDGVPTTNELIVKMLKSTNVSPGTPMWNLMMKNIYALGSYQINSQNFLLNIWYSNPATGVDIPYLPSGSLSTKQLLQVMGLDKLDAEGDRISDGLFDFTPGMTIDPANGYVIFPSVEPFGSYLRTKLHQAGYTPTQILPYVFQALYDSVLVSAQQEPNLDRYWIRGSFQSSVSSDISLGALNVPPGSVLVTAGGIKLTENVDYTVDYTLGRVKILNQGLLSSGTAINISLENNALFSIESKTFFGQHFDYMMSKDFNLGATLVNYTEHPLTQIVSIGQEPVSNTMVGLNEDFKTEAPWLTELVDKLPFIRTKAPSEITSSTEFAAMIPGHPKYIGQTGNAYIDNFEGSESFIDISQPYSWSISSIPQGQASLFPEANPIDTASTSAGYNRAKVVWYVVDPLLQQQTTNLTPTSESVAMMSDDFSRMVLQTEVFPNEQSPTGTPLNLPVLNLGFYPQLRGPYNYDGTGSSFSAGTNIDGTLASPTTRWGGIQRSIQETDFEANNIGFIEFWMMDPYNADNTNTPTSTINPNNNLEGANNTGSLYFDLGDVSEDVLPDGLKSFENGLPTNSGDSANPANINAPFTTTHWARVPINPSLVDAFDNNTASRPYQDVGLDGLSDAQEQVKFGYYINALGKKYGASSTAYTNALSDPSSDNYHYYRGDDYDKEALNVTQRYMFFNGLEGNSETQAQYGNQNPNGGNYPTTESTLPNTEDINQDNTLSTDETYYEYQVKVDPKDINPNNSGNNFITNAFLAPAPTTPDGKTHQVYWYQFKIPISSFTTKVGPIADFKSIRFIRMYFKGFDRPIMCRFAKLELVRDDWRKFTSSLLAPGDYIPNNDNITSFNMYGVNLEENAGRSPVNYVIPPGIQRQLNLQSANLAQENEGSLALQLCNLQDGDARAVYKNVQLDLRAYKNLQMFIHCESADPVHLLKDGDVTAFIRLGSDFTSNYYEYEVPLQVTPKGTYNTNNAGDQSAVWPDANQMNIDISKLENAKLARDATIGSGNSAAIALQIPYTVKDGANNITVVGNPTVSNLQVIMLGVRNPKQTKATSSTDDGQPKCTEVWFDELRMTNFSEKGGVAAITRETAKLADWGTLSVAGNVSTPGFGSLETTVGNLSRETDLGYTMATNLEMGKLLPPSWNLSIPTYLSYGQQEIIPEYNPLDPDILLSNALSTLPKSSQDSLRNEVLTITTLKSMNFTNVHKNRSKNQKKTHFYDVENLSATYAYTQQNHQDINTQSSITQTYHGNLTYNYSFHPKLIQPLIKSDFFKKNKYLALIRDFNFYPIPDKLSVSANIDRGYNAFQMRVIIPGEYIPPLPDQVSKTFNMIRNYNFSFPFTKSLKFDYTATNDSRVLEPEGQPITTKEQRDSIRNDFFTHQVNTDFKQTENLSYDIPINKLPFLDFVTASARYTASYEWMHAPFAEPSLGSTIQNSNTKQINGQFNMVMLYNKVPFIKKYMDDEKAKPQNGPNNKLMPGGKGGLLGKNAKGNKKGDSLKAAQKAPPEDTTKTTGYYIGKWVTHVLTMVKNVSGTYSDNEGLVLPGYKDSTKFFGMNPSNGWIPGPLFVFGGGQKQVLYQLPGSTTKHLVPQFIEQVIQNNWLSTDTSIFTPFTTVSTQTFSIHTTLEPIPDLKIDVTVTHSRTLSTSQYLHDSISPVNSKLFPVINTYTEAGSFSMSYFMLPTTFRLADASIFNTFRANRMIVSKRLAQASGGQSNGQIVGNGDTASYDGYGLTSQNVLIPAFLAAYSGQSANKIPLTAFPPIPFPNWTISYSGLTKIIPWVKNNTQSVTISSAYTSNYSVGSYNYNLLYNADPTAPWARDSYNNFIPKDEIPTVSLSDQFSPLIKIGVTLKNNVMSNIEIRTDRQIALNMSDLTIDEVHGEEYIMGLGYKLKNVPLPFKISNKPLKNDLTIKVDFSLRENETIIRNTEDLSSQITGGQSILSIKSQAEYNINQRVSFRLFFDKVINTPFISSSYPTSTMDGGIAIRFTLS
ncbi:MAG TPA: cell surface protein SprA [Bacteroidia bacterium]|nr:cell surface protein SprA [Bacteroidia bacterium]